jgi:hypothetical protein
MYFIKLFHLLHSAPKAHCGHRDLLSSIHPHSLTTRPIPVLEAPFMLSSCHVFLWIVLLDTHAGDMSSVFLCGFGAFYKMVL